MAWLDRATQLIIPHAEGDLTCYVAKPTLPIAGTVFLIHGRNGAARQPHMDAIARAYLHNGWSVAAPDLPYSDANPGLGAPTEITFDAHLQAAQQVYEHLKMQCTFEGMIAFCGHSLGAFAAAYLAAKERDVHHLLAVSPVLSGQHLLDARSAMGENALEALAREAPSMLATMADCTCLPALAQISAPVAVLTGELDGLTPAAHARAYFNAAPNGCFFSLVPDQHHCPCDAGFDVALNAAFNVLKL